MSPRISRTALASGSVVVRCHMAWRRVVSRVRRYPDPRFYEVLRDKPRLDPLRTADEMLDNAIRAGVPTEDVLAPAEAWLASLRLRCAARDGFSLRQLVQAETLAQAEADVVEMELVAPRPPKALIGRAIEVLTVNKTKLEQLLDGLHQAAREHEAPAAREREPLPFRRPMGVPTLRQRA